MEPWREEARNDYLMHHGIKDMHWGFNKGKRNGKRTKEMSDLERAGRNFEANKRREDALYDATWKELEVTPSKRNNSKIDRLQSATAKAMNNTDNSLFKKNGLYSRGKKILKKIQNKDPEKRLQKAFASSDPYYIKRTDSYLPHVTGTKEAQKKANKAVHRKVKAYESKQKVKSFVNNLFKKKKKR